MNIFTDHPRAAGETYLEHAEFAVCFGWSCIVAGLAAFVHAVFPFLFQKTASEKVRAMHNMLEECGRIKSDTV